MPSFERKFRVLWGWWNNFWLGRDLVNLPDRAEPSLRVRGVRGASAPAQPAAPSGRDEGTAAGDAAEKVAASR